MPAMSDQPASNLPAVLGVSELAQAIRRLLEGSFEYVRVRGEISQPKLATSGHCYLRLKDAESVLDAVIWRPVLAKLGMKPEEGLEVIATGRISAYPARSSYQLVIERMEVAGEGALLKLIAERKRRLEAEGLFDPARKKPIPYLPEVIGVVTSLTGAVIRDILHRLAERFPRHVLIWPVAVQGEAAPAQIAAAIAGFNRLQPGGAVPRPDLIIVARGGGSLEDLMAFNDEAVVRAAAASRIPLISGVGHETDTTLIDFAADRRAPTPTAAAEMAVPVRSELLTRLGELGRRQEAAALRLLKILGQDVAGLARGLPEPRAILSTATQRLDERGERLTLALKGALERKRTILAKLAQALPTPREQLARAQLRLQALARAQSQAMQAALRHISATATLEARGARLVRAVSRIVERAQAKLSSTSGRLETVSYARTLARGFALVLDPAGHALASAAAATPGMAVTLRFQDGARGAVIVQAPKPTRSKPAKPSQGSLL
ncbi:MAG: exodeoxyribonuclease VII large subunit [Alphaproteobacteria bacterium]|nr:exodeoxyribonuclease VII large subunit [Alphaproteobacteria bacterium]